MDQPCPNLCSLVRRSSPRVGSPMTLSFAHFVFTIVWYKLLELAGAYTRPPPDAMPRLDQFKVAAAMFSSIAFMKPSSRKSSSTTSFRKYSKAADTALTATTSSPVTGRTGTMAIAVLGTRSSAAIQAACGKATSEMVSATRRSTVRCTPTTVETAAVRVTSKPAMARVLKTPCWPMAPVMRPSIVSRPIMMRVIAVLTAS